MQWLPVTVQFVVGLLTVAAAILAARWASQSASERDERSRRHQIDLDRRDALARWISAEQASALGRLASDGGAEQTVASLVATSSAAAAVLLTVDVDEVSAVRSILQARARRLQRAADKVDDLTSALVAGAIANPTNHPRPGPAESAATAAMARAADDLVEAAVAIRHRAPGWRDLEDEVTKASDSEQDR